METEMLLEVKGLKVHFPVYGGVLRRKIGKVYAVDGVSLKIRRGETLGLVGESGCGKTTVGRSILNLVRLTAGEVSFSGRLISGRNTSVFRELRRDMQMIFQDPYESLNSRHTIGQIIEEPFIIHKIGSVRERSKKIRQLLERVGLTEAVYSRFPHEFSGGQRQRIGIARAIALDPKLVICDEPVSALDVSIQSQILNLLLELQRDLGLTYLFIAHDLSVVKHISDRIAVMYLGKIVEYADAHEIYRKPQHPYSVALISSIPKPDPSAKKSNRLILKGDVPSPITPPSGCRFHTRCPMADNRCSMEAPELLSINGAGEGHHLVACHYSHEVPSRLGNYLDSEARS
jgi:oligopeptide/dipeptide ABC transporter ATP-binding protein